jgi:hypothetical protein
MSTIIRKQVGKPMKLHPLAKLMKINQALKKLGVFPRPVESSTVYRKIVGKKPNGF